MTETETSIPLNQLEEIVSIVIYAAEAETLQEVLQRIANATRELVNARYAALGIPDGRGGLRYFRVSGISEEAIADIDHPPVGLGLLGAIMHEREPIRVPVIENDPRSVGFPEGHPPMTSFLGVPIRVGSQLFGMLYLTDREDNEPFTLGDQWLVETMAGYAALAIAGSQLREQQRRLTLLEERQRIGMELHDGVIQSLYAVGMHLDLMRTTGTLTEESLQQAIDGLNEVIEDIRRYIMNLKSSGRGEKTVRQALNEVIARLYIPESLVINLDAPDAPPPFKQQKFDSVCLIAREALSNVVRHADAGHLTVRCWQGDGDFHMMIKDDGQGFDLDELEESDGLGLRNIQERSQLYGGEIDIKSSPGRGTTLRVSLPIEHQPIEADGDEPGTD